MPLPLIVPIAIGVAGLVGVGKAGKAVYDNSKAKEINTTAAGKVEEADSRLQSSREGCQQALSTLGHKKALTLTHNVKDFLDVFGQIKNVDFRHDGNLGDLALKDFDIKMLDEMAKEVSFVLASGLGIGGGAVSGALTAFGAYSATMAFAAAGTGTAISTLSGAAATNATLAWLGGGTLASGGFGVAGGAMVLNVLVAGPALLIAGWYMGAKAESNLNNAKGNMAEAERFVADVDKAIAMTDGIATIADMASQVFSQVCKTSRRQLVALRHVVQEQGTDYAQYDQQGRMTVLRNVKLVQLIKALLDTPILNESGELLGDAESNFLAIREQFNAATQTS